MTAPLRLIFATLLSVSPAPAGGPTVAREDTLFKQEAEVLVRAPRVTLDEILDRVARGEARRDSEMVDQSFRVTVRQVSHTGAGMTPVVERETVARVWKKRPDRARSVTLRDVRAKKPKAVGVEPELDVGPSMAEEIVNFAFQPAARRDYRYHIAGRDLLPGPRLIYRIAFEPRSRLDPSNPSGLVWVDTNDFVIVRQELTFDRSPVPLILRDLRRLVIERTRADGFWVLHRVMLRADATLPLPHLGRTFDFALTFDDYAINRGLPDSLFAGTPARRVGAEAR